MLILISAGLCMIFSACKSPQEPDQTPNTSTSTDVRTSLQGLAEQVILDDPNVETVKVIGDKLLIRNKFSKRSLTLPFQMIIDGEYEMIQENEALAKRMLENKVAAEKSKSGPDYLAPTQGWGQTPTWIPRYPKLILSTSKIHTARPDGSIWGSISGTHSDPANKLADFLTAEFKKSGLILTHKLDKKGSRLMLMFDNTPILTDAKQEKRKVTCSISRNKETTLLTIQYAYGM